MKRVTTRLSRVRQLPLVNDPASPCAVAIYWTPLFVPDVARFAQRGHLRIGGRRLYISQRKGEILRRNCEEDSHAEF